MGKFVDRDFHFQRTPCEMLLQNSRGFGNVDNYGTTLAYVDLRHLISPRLVFEQQGGGSFVVTCGGY